MCRPKRRASRLWKDEISVGLHTKVRRITTFRSTATVPYDVYVFCPFMDGRNVGKTSPCVTHVRAWCLNSHPEVLFHISSKPISLALGLYNKRGN
jgi:hypothetical protein